jgi:hypothetical protein
MREPHQGCRVSRSSLVKDANRALSNENIAPTLVRKRAPPGGGAKRRFGHVPLAIAQELRELGARG